MKLDGRGHTAEVSNEFDDLAMHYTPVLNKEYPKHGHPKCCLTISDTSFVVKDILLTIDVRITDFT